MHRRPSKLAAGAVGDGELLERGAVQREALALYCLAWPGTKLPAAFTDTSHGARPQARAAARVVSWLPFRLVEAQWHSARWAPGVIALIMDGITPARLPQRRSIEIRKREVGGLIELERKGVKRGDRVRILRGPFTGHLAIYHDSKPRDRIEVLLQLLGSTRSATLESLDVELAK